jgi:4-carboxymuconolactone decarboxylase
MPAKRPAKSNLKSKTTKTTPAKRPAEKRPTARLPVLDEHQLNAVQSTLLEAMRSGPRGRNLVVRGPFAVWMHAPAVGQLIQEVGGFCRYQTTVPPRLSEFAILCTARQWRAQYEWFAHAPIAEKQGVKPKTIADLRAGRVPKTAAKDERAIYDLVQELYKTKRVSDRTYKRVNDILGDEATVELIAILGYYVIVSMVLNVFRMMPPDDSPLGFTEPK